MGEQPAQRTPSSHVIPHRQHMLLHGTVTLPPPVAQPLHCSPLLLVTFAHRLGLVTVLGARPGRQRAASKPGQGKAPEGPGHSCEVTGPFPSVGSALSSPSLHAYLAGQISFARASKPRHTFISRATLFSARAGSLGHASPRASPPACHSPVEPTGRNGRLEFPPLVARRPSQDRGPVLLPISRIMLPEFRGCLVAKGRLILLTIGRLGQPPSRSAEAEGGWIRFRHHGARVRNRHKDTHMARHGDGEDGAERFVHLAAAAQLMSIISRWQNFHLGHVQTTSYIQ